MQILGATHFFGSSWQRSGKRSIVGKPSHSSGCFPSSSTIKSEYISIWNSGAFEKCLLGAGAFAVSLVFFCPEEKWTSPLHPTFPRASDHWGLHLIGTFFAISTKQRWSAILSSYEMTITSLLIFKRDSQGFETHGEASDHWQGVKSTVTLPIGLNVVFAGEK